MVLVTVALLMTAMLAASAAPALARFEVGGPVTGTPVNPTACESPAVISPIIGWRDGTCWVFHVGQ